MNTKINKATIYYSITAYNTQRLDDEGISTRKWVEVEYNKLDDLQPIMAEIYDKEKAKQNYISFDMKAVDNTGYTIAYLR